MPKKTVSEGARTCGAKSNLAERLKQGAIANARRDLAITQEWFSVDGEGRQPGKPAARRKVAALIR